MNAANLDESDLELTLAYQPVLDIRDGLSVVCAYESLMRASNSGQPRAVADVIRKAEANGTMPQLDLQVAHEVCGTLVANPELKVWFNLSQRTLESEEHARDIGNIISDSAVVDRIKVEITETHEGCCHRIINNLKWFRDNRISVVIDDVEDEYALISLLDTDLVTGFKFSRSSLIAMSNNPARYAESRKLVEKCKVLGKSSVLEGIETQAQLDLAKSLGVDYAQGWLFWPALPLDSIPTPGTQVAFHSQAPAASL